MIEVGQRLHAGARGIYIVTALAEHLRFEVHTSGPCGEYVIECVPVSAGAPHAVVVGELAIAWRGPPGADEPTGLALCEAVGQQLGAGLPPARIEVKATHGRVREVSGGSVLAPAGQGNDRFWMLEPYVGCLVGCRFCYAQTRLQAFRDAARLPRAAWGSWVDVRVDAADALRRDLNSLPAAPIKFTPVRSDPYHAVEKRYQLTRACLEVIASRPIPPRTIVLTRCTLASRDFDILAGLATASFGVSIPTADDWARRHFEPLAAATHERFELLAQAREQGIDTFAVVQPMLPGKPERLADLLAANVDSVSLDTLHGEHGAAELFNDAGFTNARDPMWQQQRLHELVELLTERGVPVWKGELPPV